MSENSPILNMDYGPLTGLVGTWQGNKGLDVAPGPDRDSSNPYYETLNFTAIGDVVNAKTQKLAVIRYQQIVRRLLNDEIFHDQTGYWMWDAAAQTVMHAITIPRGVCILAGGELTQFENHGDDIVLEVSARLDDPEWGIVQSPFMRDQAKTVEFNYLATIQGNKLIYKQTTTVEIYGRTIRHTDQNELFRCEK